MSEPGEEFGEASDRLKDVHLAEHGEYIETYTGELTDAGTPVRIITLASDIAENDQAVDAFGQVSDQWYNASANATVLGILERDTTPRPWIAVPYANVETLQAVQARLSPAATETVISETADALRTLGLYNTVHGHLSPDDIWVTDADDGTDEPTVRLGGFGIEQAVRATVGDADPTPYTAPELLDDPGQPSERTDVYGLGAVAYFALTGRPPVEGSDLERAIRDGPDAPPSEHLDTIPSAVDEVLMRALSEQPADRQESPYVFSRAFLSAFAPEQLGPPEDSGETAESPQATDSSAARDDSQEDGPQAGDTDTDETDATETDRSLTPRTAIGVVGIVAMVIVGAAGVLAFGGGIVGDTGDVPVEEANEDDIAGDTGDRPADGTESAETEARTDTPTRSTSESIGTGESGDSGGQDDASSTSNTPLSAVESDDPFAGATEFDGTAYNASQQTNALMINDTANDRELVELNRPSKGSAIVYTTNDYVAYRNTTTGTVRYGESDGAVGRRVVFRAAFTALTPVFYVDIVEWEQIGTTTVDGQDALVYGSSSFNETGYETASRRFDFEPSDVRSTGGRMIISSDGRIHSVTVEIETTQGTYGGDLSVTYDDSTVDKPDWVDESQAP